MIRYLTDVVAPRRATGILADIYGEIRRDFGLVPEPFTLHSPAPAVLAGFWAAVRESLVAGVVPRRRKEIVASAVSAANRCPYCVDAHTIFTHAASPAGPAGAASDARLGQWGAATRTPGSPALADPPFAAPEAPEYVGVAVAFHYINRLVTILLGDSPVPGPAGPWRPALRRMAALRFALAVRRAKTPGAALGRLPAVPLPPDMAWASGSEAVAGALARFAYAVDGAGERALPGDVRALVAERVAAWKGEDLGVSRAWADEAVDRLGPADRPAGRLALLTALAPHQVDAGTVAAFRSGSAGDGQLIGALAWPSLTAARRIATWIPR